AVYRYANSAEHRPSTGVAADEIRRNVSKWSIGGRRDQDGIPRCAVVVYNPLSDRDIFGLHSYFECIIEVRDRLAGREILRDSVLLPDRFNACRVQIYPAGGGFLGEHRDLRGQSNLPEGLYLELLLLLTQRGVDYQKGGGSVRYNGVKVDSEAGSRRGDVVVYDGATIHGVADIDPGLAFDATNLRGRAVAMATIYDNR